MMIYLLCFIVVVVAVVVVVVVVVWDLMVRMEQKLERFITKDTDYNDLLLYHLENLVREAAHYLKIRHGTVDPKQVQVKIDDFERKVRLRVAMRLHASVPFQAMITLSCNMCVRCCLALTLQARKMDISDLEPFYASNSFAANHFQLDRRKGAIIRQF